MTRVAVVVPVGPLEAHQRYLDEALQSIADQIHLPDDVVVVDDMAGLATARLETIPADVEAVLYETPWRLGVAAAFNAGVGVAIQGEADLIVMLGADDRLMPDAIEAIVATYEANERRDAYYWMGVRYSDGREDQFLPCHAAGVTPGLWRLTGGFSPAMGLWAPDAAFVSVLLAHRPELLQHGVAVDREADGRPLYWHRVHDAQETADGFWWAQSGIGNAVRDHVTETWQPAEGWGRYS